MYVSKASMKAFGIVIDVNSFVLPDFNQLKNFKNFKNYMFKQILQNFFFPKLLINKIN